MSVYTLSPAAIEMARRSLIAQELESCKNTPSGRAARISQLLHGELDHTLEFQQHALHLQMGRLRSAIADLAAQSENEK